jgi:hypothetical protein
MYRYILSCTLYRYKMPRLQGRSKYLTEESKYLTEESSTRGLFTNSPRSLKGIRQLVQTYLCSLARSHFSLSLLQRPPLKMCGIRETPQRNPKYRDFLYKNHVFFSTALSKSKVFTSNSIHHSQIGLSEQKTLIF